MASNSSSLIIFQASVCGIARQCHKIRRHSHTQSRFKLVIRIDGGWDFPSRFIPCRLHKHAAYWQWQPRGPNQSGFSYEDAVRSIQVDVVTVPEVCSGWFLFLASPVDGQSHEQQPTERILQPLTNRMLPYIRHMPTHVAAHEI